MRLRPLLILLLSCACLFVTPFFAAIAAQPSSPTEPQAPVRPLQTSLESGDFAALSVRPFGAQNLDLASGVTTLPEGGEVIDRERGVTLSGAFVRFLEGDFIEVSEATVTGDFGHLEAAELRFEVGPQMLSGGGGVRFVGDGLELSAERVQLALADGVAVLGGEVSSLEPALSGAGALIDTSGRQALLLGPYSYSDGPVTLRGAEGERLALEWDEAGALSAETGVPEALVERFAAYLP